MWFAELQSRMSKPLSGVVHDGYVGRLKMQDRKMRDQIDQRLTDTTGKCGTKIPGWENVGLNMWDWKM